MYVYIYPHMCYFWQERSIASYLFAIVGSSFVRIDCRCGLAMDLLALHNDLKLVPLDPDPSAFADAGGQSSRVPTLKGLKRKYYTKWVDGVRHRSVHPDGPMTRGEFGNKRSLFRNKRSLFRNKRSLFRNKRIWGGTARCENTG